MVLPDLPLLVQAYAVFLRYSKLAVKKTSMREKSTTLSVLREGGLILYLPIPFGELVVMLAIQRQSKKCMT